MRGGGQRLLSRKVLGGGLGERGVECWGLVDAPCAAEGPKGLRGRRLTTNAVSESRRGALNPGGALLLLGGMGGLGRGVSARVVNGGVARGGAGQRTLSSRGSGGAASFWGGGRELLIDAPGGMRGPGRCLSDNLLLEAVFGSCAGRSGPGGDVRDGRVEGSPRECLAGYGGMCRR